MKKLVNGLFIIAVVVFMFQSILNVGGINNLPSTGQDMTIIFIFLGLAICAILLFVLIKKRNNK
ncbi:LPXTG-motif cell wall-anchored protein [Bacilli bacterium PM5-9]|nr:LPXTG-motif cell wall-anchored protein [Bacilli bacterium PM5-9]